MFLIIEKNEDIIQSCQIQIGSKLIPDYPLQSRSEALYFLKKTQNLDSVFNNHVHTFNIKAQNYLYHKGLIVFDTEKVNGHTVVFTGMNVKHGEQITLKMQLPNNNATIIPDDCRVVLEAEWILEIRGSYVRVAN